MNALAAQVAPVSTWSPYQNDIYNFVSIDPNDYIGMMPYDWKRNGIIKAVAGSGKSTTIVEAMRRIRPGLSAVFLAFNKAIADELKRRGVNARTFHSLVFSTVMRHKNQREVETSKLKIIIDNNLTGREVKLYGAFVRKLVGLARNAGIGCLEPDTYESWAALAEYHDLELESEAASFDSAINICRGILHSCYQSPMVDFDDMLYLAVRDGLSLPKFDFIFVDEAQDTNAIQRAILRKIVKPTSRLIAVGDPSQSIYGFRGADSNSMDLIKEEFNCHELPLTVSYRCATSIVEFARKWVSHIEPAPNAPQGSVEMLGQDWNAKTFASGDLIVCRTTKPLVTLVYQLIKMHIPAVILGKEIGAGLISLINKLGGENLEELSNNLYAWSIRESEKAIARKQESKAEQIYDKRDALLTLMDALTEADRSVDGLIRLIERLFSDKTAAITLATIHKSKGLEASRVFWLNSSQCPAKWARQPWQQQQEVNLCYVATTRAKSKLVLIEEKSRE